MGCLRQEVDLHVTLHRYPEVVRALRHHLPVAIPEVVHAQVVVVLIHPEAVVPVAVEASAAVAAVVAVPVAVEVPAVAAVVVLPVVVVADDSKNIIEGLP